MIAEAMTVTELILWLGGLGVFLVLLPGAASSWAERRRNRNRWKEQE